MKCTHEKVHDQLSFSTLKHFAAQFDEILRAVGGITDQSERERLCGSFIHRMAYFFDNQWVRHGQRYFRIGLCFQEFTDDPFKPVSGTITDYAEGEMLHEAAVGIVDSHFTNDDTVTPKFQEIGDVYDQG